LESVGATVIISQFGQAEMLAGTNTLPQFLAAYAQLLNHFSNGGRRVVLIVHRRFRDSRRCRNLRFDPADTAGVIAQMALRRGHPFCSLADAPFGTTHRNSPNP